MKVAENNIKKYERLQEASARRAEKEKKKLDKVDRCTWNVSQLLVKCALLYLKQEYVLRYEHYFVLK